jgi:hypothetical protein
VAEAEAEHVLLAVVAEDTATAMLYRTDEGFVLETVIWPAMWDTRGRFSRDLSPNEAAEWAAGHGVDIEMEAV